MSVHRMSVQKVDTVAGRSHRRLGRRRRAPVMTTVHGTSTADQTDLARLDDDGGAPPRIRSHRLDGATPARERGPRLSMSPVGAPGGLDGAWWPTTGDLASELRDLVTALAASPAGHLITRVSVNAAAWSDIPDRVALPARSAVRVSWYRTLDPYLITLGRAAAPRIRLLVIPPGAAPEPARVLLRGAATGQLVGSPGGILDAAGALGHVRTAAGRPDLGRS